MSVTFSPAMESMQYQISCGCGEAVAKKVFPSFDVAYKIFTSKIPFEKPVCTDEDCIRYYGNGFRVRAVDEDELTVSAGRVMHLLGLENDGQCGSVDGNWLLGKVQEKLAELPVVTTARPVISVGGYDGYEQDVLARLEVVASYAADRNAQVVWG